MTEWEDDGDYYRTPPSELEPLRAVVRKLNDAGTLYSFTAYLGEGDRCSGVRETLEAAKQAAERRLG